MKPFWWLLIFLSFVGAVFGFVGHAWAVVALGVILTVFLGVMGVRDAKKPLKP